MVFRHFTLQVALQLLLMVLLTGLSTYFYLEQQGLSATILALFILINAIVLIHSFNRTNRTIAYFFESVQNNDSQLRFTSHKKNRSIERLYNSMNRLNTMISEAKLQNRLNEEYYRALIQQSATGLVAMDENNHIDIANDKACLLVGLVVPVNFKRLQNTNSELWELLCSIKIGQTQIYKTHTTDTHIQLLIRATGIRIHKRQIKLISIHDITHELDVNETESWQKLISILTHEIMNSIAPITSLTSTLTNFYYKENHPITPTQINEQLINNTIQGLQIIGERSAGLQTFVSTYRRLTHVPTPTISPFDTTIWLNNIKVLLHHKLEQNNVTLNLTIHKAIQTINADEILLTQVLINLLYNAIDALSEQTSIRTIDIAITPSNQKNIQISVSNNGPVIPQDIRENLFVPFYTTKKNGSGIGLTLSRQIIQLHQGQLTFESSVELTRFVIVL